MEGGFGPDLAVLLRLLAAGQLDVELGWRGSWEQIHQAAAALTSRQILGKAVLRVDECDRADQAPPGGGNPVILVTGATGNIGGSLVQQLVAAGRPVRALVRSPGAKKFAAEVDVVPGDLAMPASLDAVFDGVTGLFLLGGFPTLAAVLARARTAGVGQVALLTSRCVIGGAPDNAITAMWLGAEAALRESGLPGTVLRPAGFQSNLLRWKDQWDQGDVVRAPWPEVAIAAIDPADIAAVAAVVLTDSAYLGQALELSGPEALTPSQQVAILADALGRPLRYEAQPEDEARAQMSGTMPEPFVQAQFRFFSAGEYDDSTVLDTVARLTGRPAGTLQAWIAAHREALTATD